MELAEVRRSLQEYFAAWRQWSGEAQEAAGLRLGQCKPTNFGWKVADLATFNAALTDWMARTAQLHVSTVNERKLGLLVPDQPIEGVPIVEIMQRRPGSSDPLGLDHVAFYYPDTAELKKVLSGTNFSWEEQGNNHHSWISVMFGDKPYEAKFFNHTALKVAVIEMREVDDRLMAEVH
jgi:hypothetical protein